MVVYCVPKKHGKQPVFINKTPTGFHQWTKNLSWVAYNFLRDHPPEWLKSEEKRLRHARKIKKGSGRRYLLAFDEMVAMLLLYARAYVTHEFFPCCLMSMTALSAGILPGCVLPWNPFSTRRPRTDLREE